MWINGSARTSSGSAGQSARHSGHTRRPCATGRGVRVSEERPRTKRGGARGRREESKLGEEGTREGAKESTDGGGMGRQGGKNGPAGREEWAGRGGEEWAEIGRGCLCESAGTPSRRLLGLCEPEVEALGVYGVPAVRAGGVRVGYAVAASPSTWTPSRTRRPQAVRSRHGVGQGAQERSWAGRG